MPTFFFLHATLIKYFVGVQVRFKKHALELIQCSFVVFDEPNRTE